MRKLNWIILFWGMALMYSQAQSAKPESVRELFHVMKQDSMIEKMFTSMIPTMLKQMQVKELHGKDSTLMQYTMQVGKEMCFNVINEDMVTLYSKYFSEKEINDLIVFYKTPAAQKLVSVTPEISKELITIMMKKYMPNMMKQIQDKVKSLEGTDVE